MLCNLSANLTNKTLISLDVAKISFLKLSPTVKFFFSDSNLDIFVTPSTSSAISLPNIFLTSLNVA